MKEPENKRGLNPEECAELIKYIQQNNSWENMYDIFERNRNVSRRIIKYYSLRFDTRTGDMWVIIFGTGDNTHSIQMGPGEDHDAFKKKIYDYLDEDISKNKRGGEIISG
jgi:hypothetical protein